jgi:hypothetical protein
MRFPDAYLFLKNRATISEHCRRTYQSQASDTNNRLDNLPIYFQTMTIAYRSLTAATMQRVVLWVGVGAGLERGWNGVGSVVTV